MDLVFTPEEKAFRAEVRSFFQSEIPLAVREKVRDGRRLSREELVQSQRTLHARGWAVPSWPKEWGGQDWSPTRQYIFLDELQLQSVPPPLAFNVNMIGPVIAAYGTEAQKQHFLPRIANLDDWFCQGFSEPGAGSDLASLRTGAVLDGDHYVVNGQKTWTTLAHFANWMFCLVRTDPAAKKQAGVTMLLIDMASPGVTVRPIVTIDGAHDVNEVFLDDVRVPVTNRIGEENRGWTYAKVLLGRERMGMARTGISKARALRIRELAERTPAGSGMLIDDPGFRERLTAIEIDLLALEMAQLRVVANAASAAKDAPDPASSILKFKGSELQQATLELLMEVGGVAALRFFSDDREGEALENQVEGWLTRAAPNHFAGRKLTIFGGTSEVQKNVVAKSMLGL